ncbi:MAG: ABC transporter permease [Anaerolineales bacterium]|nr:ABC transporter permease [Anaerolineales bacterium]
MLNFILKRTGSLLVTLILASIVVFILIELPPGDYAERYAFKQAAAGVTITEQDILSLKEQLGLNEPLWQRYLHWISNVVLHGNFGVSFQYQKPVTEVIGERLLYTFIIAFGTLIFTYALAVPIGLLSAVYQYSIGDMFFTVIGYLGLAIPNFLLALILLYFSVKYFDTSVGGLFSQEFMNASWSWARVVDLLKHLWVPAVVLGMGGTAFQIRTIRATMLDEKSKLYVKTARAKGLSEWQTLIRYPVRVALNPIVSTLGWELTNIISGAPIVATVLSLPDTGPLMLNALLDQDMYLAGAMLMMLTFLTVLGTFISDVLLALLDPRVRLGNLEY